MMNRKHIMMFLGILFGNIVLMPASAQDNPALLDKIETCKAILADRDRLFCFDETFNTPIFSSDNHISSPSVARKPQEWLEIQSMEQKRAADTIGFLGTTKSLEFYDSLYFTQSVEDLGVVVLSCINNISRVEIMLDKPLQKGVVPVSISGKNNAEYQWLLDDTGYILREGRGLPSIATTRNLMGESQFSLSINDRHYTLSLKDFDTQVKALQTLCHWR